MSRQHKSRPRHLATVGELDTKALVDTLADKLSEIKNKTLGYTLGHLLSEALLDKLAHTIAEVKVQKLADLICDVKALALVDVLDYMLACKKRKTHSATPGEMWRLPHCSRR